MTAIETLRSESFTAADLRNDEVIAWLWEMLKGDSAGVEKSKREIFYWTDCHHRSWAPWMRQ